MRPLLTNVLDYGCPDEFTPGQGLRMRKWFAMRRDAIPKEPPVYEQL